MNQQIQKNRPFADAHRITIDLIVRKHKNERPNPILDNLRSEVSLDYLIPERCEGAKTLLYAIRTRAEAKQFPPTTFTPITYKEMIFGLNLKTNPRVACLCVTYK